MEIILRPLPKMLKFAFGVVSFIWQLLPIKRTSASKENDIPTVILNCQAAIIKLVSEMRNVPNNKEKNCYSDKIQSLNVIFEALTSIQPMIEEIRQFAPQFDFPDSLPSNGYRSFVTIAEKAVRTCSSIVEETVHGSKTFSCYNGSKTQLVEISDHLKALVACFDDLVRMKNNCKNKSLFVNEGFTVDQLIEETLKFDQKCFYGSFLANAFGDGIKDILKLVSLLMVSYSEWHYGPLTRLVRPLLYAVSNRARAERHVQLIHHADVHFHRALWDLSENPFMIIPMKIYNPIAVSEAVEFNYKSVIVDGLEVLFDRKEASLVRGRLISKRIRRGMKMASRSSAEPSHGLVIHVHGGGFISQSSQSQEVFLRRWANSLDVPIFSIDYSRAPEAKFPTPVFEVFYAYCIALANPSLLGWTGERVVLTGDSAGANLILAAMLECIRRGIRRPNGLMLAYVPVLIDFVPSPARLLGILDPFLPWAVLMRAAKAYTGNNDAKDCVSSKAEHLCAVCSNTLRGAGMECKRIAFLISVTKNPSVSPYLAADHVLAQMPPTSLCSSTFDPCLDDTIMFAKKLQGLAVPVTLDVEDGLPHGFLNLCGLNKKAAASVKKCSKRISALLNLDDIMT